jgi:hypothetical protein
MGGIRADSSIYSQAEHLFEPGHSVGELGGQMVQMKADYQFASLGSILLSPDTDYYVVFKGPGPEQMTYYEVSAPNPSYFYKSETGATAIWFGSASPDFRFCTSCNGVLGVDWYFHSAINRLEVSGTLQAVPEPATGALAIAGFLAFLVSCRRK